MTLPIRPEWNDSFLLDVPLTEAPGDGTVLMWGLAPFPM